MAWLATSLPGCADTLGAGSQTPREGLHHRNRQMLLRRFPISGRPGGKHSLAPHGPRCSVGLTQKSAHWLTLHNFDQKSRLGASAAAEMPRCQRLLEGLTVGPQVSLSARFSWRETYLLCAPWH